MATRQLGAKEPKGLWTAILRRPARADRRWSRAQRIQRHRARSTREVKKRGSVGERRASGERKYLPFEFRPLTTNIKTLAATIKATHRVCRQQVDTSNSRKNWAIDHFEGRSLAWPPSFRCV